MKNKVATVIKAFVFIYFLLLLVGGYVLGDTFQMQDPAFIILEYKVFNWPLTIATWISGSIVCFILYGIAEIITLLEEVKRKMEDKTSD